MSFNTYESKPVTRLAHKIEANDVIQALPDCTYAIRVDEVDVLFKAYTTPVVGDYVVYLNDGDIYHCSAEVFAERNIVEPDTNQGGDRAEV
ncbi:hypothetical protein [Vreelandella venusta]|uniref:hypothetical protein n=1 Tax=Vreelandella venusta TaxID=44935 RepID=UPI001173EA98|nr:hypothetical protein [Halomonas venusta]GEK52358.1 hypothetical protein HVE01_30790 [Halomonas venusta]